LIGKWLRDAFSDPAGPSRQGLTDSNAAADTASTQPTKSDKEGKAGGSESKEQKRSRIDLGVTLPDLIAAGVLTTPLRLFRKYKGQTLEATLLPSGRVEFQGVQYDSCSSAAEAARLAVTGQRMSTNGWDFWQYRDGAGKRLSLDNARERFVRTKGGQTGPPDQQEQPERHRLRLKFWTTLLDRPKAKGTRHAKITPGGWHHLAAGSGVRGAPFQYAIGQREGAVELTIDRGPGTTAENKDIFDRLHKHKGEIETAFGGPLSWQRLDDKQCCRIAYSTAAGGYRSDESEWPTIQDTMIDAMMRLEKALMPHLDKLRTELRA
jgi:hypothetical protein